MESACPLAYKDENVNGKTVRIPTLVGETGKKCATNPKEGEGYYFHPLPINHKPCSTTSKTKCYIKNNKNGQFGSWENKLSDNGLCFADGSRPRMGAWLYDRDPPPFTPNNEAGIATKNEGIISPLRVRKTKEMTHLESADKDLEKMMDFADTMLGASGMSHLKNFASKHLLGEAQQQRARWGKAKNAIKKKAKKVKAKVKKVVKKIKAVIKRGLGALASKAFPYLMKTSDAFVRKLATKMNFWVGGQKQSNLGDMMWTVVRHPLKKALDEGTKSKSLHAIPFAHLSTEILEGFLLYRRDILQQGFKQILRYTSNYDYVCTECGPRYKADQALELACINSGKALQPGYAIALFPSLDRNAPHYEVLIGKVPTSLFYSKGGNGEMFKPDFDKMDLTPKSFPGMTQFYDYARTARANCEGNDCWESKYPPKTGMDPWNDAKCLVQVKLRLNLCTTCCCKGGLTKQNLGVDLVKKVDGMQCDAWFSMIQLLVNYVVNVIRLFHQARQFSVNGRCLT